GPEAMIVAPPCGTMKPTYWRNWSANHSARIRPPQPLGSLPMPRKSIFHGSSRPLRRRSWASVELVGEVMYSTHCIASRGVPVPTLTLRKVLAPTSSANSKNSRSEEHTSELQSRENLVCRLLLEK